MHRTFQMGSVVVRPDLNRIDREHERVHVEPKAMDVLCHLARNAREVVSKDDLVAAVWQEDFVSDEVLTQAIFQLRRALGDDARRPRYIQTIPRRGYRLMVPAEFPPEEPRERYRLIEKIGEGGLAEVFLAEDTLLRRKVALKVVKRGMDSKELLGRFQVEQRALALLKHPNIAHIHDCGIRSDGRAFVVLDYIRGPSIDAYCDRHHLDVDDRLRLFLKLCAAVRHAHDRGILHRDLKPSNVLVEVVDGEPQPRVIDFGLAKALGAPLTDVTLNTQHQTHLLGTPDYMSPEQVDCSPDIDDKADVFSLGALLYLLLCGFPPLDFTSLGAHSPELMASAIRAEAPQAPSERIRRALEAPIRGREPPEAVVQTAARRRTTPQGLAESLEGELDRILLKTLEKDRVRRHGSVADLAAEIAHYLGIPQRRVPCEEQATAGAHSNGESHSSKGHPPPPQLPAPQPVPRPSRKLARVGLLTAALLLTLVIGVLVIPPFFQADTPDGADSSQPVTLAVLRPTNFDRADDTQYFSDGLGQTLIDALGSTPGLRVINPSSSFRFGGRLEGGTDIEEACRVLGVSHLVETTVRRLDNSVNMGFRLIGCRSGFIVWSHQEESALAEIYQLQHQVTRQIANQLSVRLELPEGGPFHREYTKADELYLQGRAAMRDPRQWPSAILLFERAVDLNPEMSQAHAGVAMIKVLSQYFDPANRVEMLEGARQAAHRALREDSFDPWAHTAVGYVQTYLDWDFDAAEKSFRTAIALRPSEAFIHSGYGELLVFRRKFADALREARRAYQLDPLTPNFWSWIGGVLELSGRTEEAIAHLERPIPGGSEHLFHFVHLRDAYMDLTNPKMRLYSRYENCGFDSRRGF